jgi:hypothetical protein
MYYIVNERDQYLFWDYTWQSVPYAYTSKSIAWRASIYASVWCKGVVTTRNNERIIVKHKNGKQLDKLPKK